jgi:hypothetical protein
MMADGQTCSLPSFLKNTLPQSSQCCGDHGQSRMWFWSSLNGTDSVQPEILFSQGTLLFGHLSMCEAIFCRCFFTLQCSIGHFSMKCLQSFKCVFMMYLLARNEQNLFGHWIGTYEHSPTCFSSFLKFSPLHENAQSPYLHVIIQCLLTLTSRSSPNIVGESFLSRRMRSLLMIPRRCQRMRFPFVFVFTSFILLNARRGP